MTAAVVASFAVALTQAEEIILATMDSDLQFLLSEFEVPVQIQLKLAILGSKSIPTFTVMADDRPGMRLAIAADLIDATEAHLAPAVAATARTVTTALLAAWMSSEQKVAAKIRAAADGSALRLPALLSRPAIVALRQKFETAHGRVNDSVWPCISFVEKRLEEAEEGTCSAPSLTEVISLDRAQDDHIVLSEVGINVKVRKAVKDIAPPASTEEFRTRLKTLAIAYVLAGYKHGNRLWLRSATLQVFQDYTDHMLSDEVAGFALDQDGLSVAASWSTVISYEHALRKCACRAIMYDGKDFATALNDAIKDQAVKGRYFVTPTAILAAAAGGRPQRAPNDYKGSGKGNQVGDEGSSAKKRKLDSRKAGKAASKGKGSGKSGKSGKGVKTPDGRFVCPYYNTAAGCKKDKCNYVHLCNLCMGEHSAASKSCN